MGKKKLPHTGFFGSHRLFFQNLKLPMSPERGGGFKNKKILGEKENKLKVQTPHRTSADASTGKKYAHTGYPVRLHGGGGNECCAYQIKYNIVAAFLSSGGSRGFGQAPFSDDSITHLHWAKPNPILSLKKDRKNSQPSISKKKTFKKTTILFFYT